MNRTAASRILVFSAALFLIPAIGWSHPEHGTTTGWGHGLAHPFGGWDHLLAMLAIGLWAAQRGGHSLWSLPLTFVLVMLLGAGVGLAGLSSLPFLESGIIGSVLVFGVVVALAFRIPLLSALALTGFFAFFHGFAHGTEMPAGSSIAGYLAGFVLGTAILHGLGVVAGRLAMQSAPVLLRGLGAGVAVCGLVLAVAG